MLGSKGLIRPGTYHRLAAAALLVAVACKSDLHPVGPGDDTGTVDSPALPVLEVVRPTRGAFLDDEVRVSGHVLPGTGTVTSLLIDDEQVELESDNTFDTTLHPDPGMLILGTRVEDDLGERAVDGRAVQVGDTHPPGAMIDGALAIQIGPAMLDDGESDFDDLAAVAAAVFEDPSTADSLVGETFTGTFDVTITGIRFGEVEVDLIPQSGLMWTDAYISDVDLEFSTSIIGIGIDGWASASLAAMQTDLVVGTDSNGVTADAAQVYVWLEGFAWGADGVPEWAEDLLSDTVYDMIVENVEAKAKEMVASMVGETLSSFAVDTTFGDGDDLRVHMEIGTAEVVPEGMMLTMDAAVSAEDPGISLPPGAGSLATPGAAPALPIATTLPLVVLADDDFVNQMLFAFWHAGALGGWELNALELAAMTGEALPPPLGPVEEATLDVGLPPVLSPPKGDMDLDLSIGELVIGIEREDGVEIKVSINTRAGAELVFVDEGLSVALDDRPAQMTIHAGMLEWPEVLDPGDLASLFRLSTPSLLGRSSSLLPAFPAPALPIGEMLDVPAVSDLTWELADADVKVEPNGWLVLEGRMLPR